MAHQAATELTTDDAYIWKVMEKLGSGSEPAPAPAWPAYVRSKRRDQPPLPAIMESVITLDGVCHAENMVAAAQPEPTTKPLTPQLESLLQTATPQPESMTVTGTKRFAMVGPPVAKARLTSASKRPWKSAAKLSKAAISNPVQGTFQHVSGFQTPDCARPVESVATHNANQHQETESATPARQRHGTVQHIKLAAQSVQSWGGQLVRRLSKLTVRPDREGILQRRGTVSKRKFYEQMIMELSPSKEAAEPAPVPNAVSEAIATTTADQTPNQMNANFSPISGELLRELADLLPFETDTALLKRCLKDARENVVAAVSLYMSRRKKQ